MYYGSDSFVKDGREFTIVATQDDSGGDYEWSTVALLREDSTGQLYFVSDSGCSCNSFLDYTDSADLQPVKNWQEAVELLKSDPPYHFSENDTFAFAEQLNNLRPTPSPQQ